MSSNRLRLLLVSMMAVFAISAVASASASASCYKVAEAGTGHWENSACTVVGATKEYVEVAKLETEIKPGEWCAKVKVGEPSTFEDNKCTKAKVGTGEFTKVLTFKLQWDVCEETTELIIKEPPTKYDAHKCNTKIKPLAERKWEWKILAPGETRKVKSWGGAFTLAAGGKVIKCTAVTDKGIITGGKPGTDEATEIKFTGCTTKQAGCSVKTVAQPNGTILATTIPTKLEERAIGGVQVEVDNVEQNATTKELVTLKFEAEGGKSCSEYPETKLKGTVSAEVVPGTGELNFPTTAIEKDTLEFFGIKAALTGKDTQELENGWAVTGI